ncbi:hypothetical protein GEMRC1_006198 [Eukaryota sp. GEM-RC1]
MHIAELSSSKILGQLFGDKLLTDHDIIFNGTVTPVHRAVLICSSDFFRSLWCMGFADQNDPTSDFSSLPVSDSNFESFLNYLYGQPLTILPDNCYHFLYLARYFQVQSLSSFVDTLLETNSNFVWTSAIVSGADKCNDFASLCRIFSSLLSNSTTSRLPSIHHY